MNNQLAECLANVKQKTPLVHAITNYVTINDCANVLLAVGASPAMCEAVDEVFEFSQISNALYLNIGTLTKEQEMAMYLAIRGAALKNVPVVLDPVGCAAIPKKLRFINRLKNFGPFTVIKGNMGEIKALAGLAAQVRGVDSLDDGNGGLEACQKLAREMNCVVAATGKTDIVTDGKRACLIGNGTEMFSRITGAGCMVGALAAAFCSVNHDHYQATVAALVTMNLAGELASESDGGNQPGTFKAQFFDMLGRVGQKSIQERGLVKCL